MLWIEIIFNCYLKMDPTQMRDFKGNFEAKNSNNVISNKKNESNKHCKKQKQYKKKIKFG